MWNKSSQIISHNPARPIRRFVPKLQPLEDRLAPATYYVNTTLDDVTENNSKFSLREAIHKANLTASADVIVLPAGVFMIALRGEDENANATGDFDITAPLSIVGKGATLTTVNGNDLDRVFHVLGTADAAIDVKFQGLTITNGFAFDGAGILMKHANVTVRSTTVRYNTAIWSGGGISNFTDHTKCNLTLIGSIVSSNDSQGGDGGGIYVDNGTITAASSRIVLNDAGASGGGIAGSEVNLTRCLLIGNTSVLWGGGLSGTNVTMTDSTIRDNRAEDSGGGVYAGIEANLIRSLVVRNSAGKDGGGIYAATADLTNSSIKLNRGRSGGGIWGNSVFLNGTTVSLNSAPNVGDESSGRGGGIFAVTADLMKSTVSGNFAGIFGGGIKAATAILRASTVSGNIASTGNGGGIFADTADSAGTATLIDSTVSGNFAPTGNGGGIRAGTLNLTNSTISGNRASYGGGVFAAKGAFLNATIAENTGGGVSQYGSETLTVENTIIASNLYGEVSGYFNSQGHNLIGQIDGASGFNLALGDLWGISEFPLDPMLGELRYNGGKTQTHALLAGSPAIDKGDNADAPAFDQRGVRRPRDGNSDGIRIVDIGAFER